MTSISLATGRLAAVQASLVSLESKTEFNPPFPFPVSNSLVSFWRAKPHELDNHRSTEELPKSCDVVIIGSGFSGTSIAYHLRDENANPPSIVILEARQACSGATGRNGGHIKPDVYFNFPKYQRAFGTEAAKEIALFESSQVFALKDLVEKEKIDCDFILTRSCDVYMDAEHAAKTKKEYDALIAAKIPSVRDVQYGAGKEAEALSGVKGAKAAFSFTAGQIWPYKMVMHLLSGLVKKGVNLQTHTPVMKVSETQDHDGYWTVSTSRGQLKARKVVFATNGYTAGVQSLYEEKIVPVRGICSRITVAEGKISPYIPTTHSVRYGPGFYDYQIARSDGSIIVGGARHKFLTKLDEWYNVTDDSKLIEPARAHFDGLMQRTFRGWEDTGATVDKIWTGVMGYTSDLMPHIGEIPSKSDQFICAGFNGHGMPIILLAAKGVAKLMREGCSFEETGVPAVMKTSQARLDSTYNAILETAPQ